MALPADLSLGLRTSPGVCMACIRQPPPVRSMLVAVDYAYPWSALISRYKFGNCPGLAPLFAELLLNAPGVRAVLADLHPSDLIIPVPLSKQRLQTRGFNQSWELAKALASRSGSRARVDGTALLRIKNTQPQTELNREARLANVKDAFQPDPLRTTELFGRHVVLVDDVITSGASIFTAAQALLSHGAARVTGMVFARTPF